MFHYDWKKEIFTVPNLLSFLRLLLIPTYTAIYLNAHSDRDYFFSAVLLGISCLTDFADGRIARKYHLESTLGKILDPIADKATQLSLLLCLLPRHPILRYVLGLFLIKEAFQLIAGINALAHGKMLTGALTAGKISTTVFFVSLILLILFPHMKESAVTRLAEADLFFLLISFISYFFAYYGKNPKTIYID